MVGHESQIPDPGDYVRSRMGEESVIVSRGRDGELNVLQNSCAHRAMKVCRVVYRSRGDGDRNWLVGSRQDLLRRDDTSFLIARRRAILDDTVVPAPNLAVFF
jgi:hypothetical protein